MSEHTNSFAWTRQLECPPTVCSDSVKKILCKGVLELLWEDISNSVVPVNEAHKIRKNILLHKLRHGLNDSTIASVRDLTQLRSKDKTLKQQVSAMDKEYDEQNYIVRQKMQHLKDIKNQCSKINTRKDFMKLKHSETSKQLQDCSEMRRICQHLMPNTSKDVDQQQLRENLHLLARLRSAENKKEIWKKISSSLGKIDIHTLWTYMYRALSQDLDTIVKLEIKHDFNSSTVGENIDIGIARACGQHILMMTKQRLSNSKTYVYEQHIIELIELIESLSNDDMGTWLAFTLEVKKLEADQARLQNEVQQLKNNIQENSLLNIDIAQLTTEIETIDAQIDGYVKDIQQSIGILNSTSRLIYEVREKLNCASQRIIALQAVDYDPKCVTNALDIELDIFYNILDLDALRKVMLKGDVGLYRHAICGLDKASITTINPQYSRIKSYFPMMQMPIYCLIECYRNAIANIIYTKLNCSTSTEDIERPGKLAPPWEKCDYNTLELINLSKMACDQAGEEIEHFNAILSAWINQDVQEVMQLTETTVDGVSFKDWLQRYNILMYMIRNGK